MKLRRRSKRYYGPVCGGDAQKPRVVCLHSTEGTTAASAAAYLKNNSGASVHYVVDDQDTFYTQTPKKTACGAGGFNTGVIHIEQAGFASWSRKQWLRRLRTLRRAAYWTAVELRKWDIKPKYLKGPHDLKFNSGVTFHAWVTAAGYPTTHTDPGPHYPFWKQRALIRFYYHRIGRRG